MNANNKLQARRPKGSGVSSKIGQRFAKLLEQGIIRDRTKPRSDGRIGNKTVPLPKALQIGKKAG